MEKPLIKLGPKQWLSGIAANAHTETGGIFFKADGITPLYDAGGTASPENGLLQAGPTPTDFTGNVIVDSITAGVETGYSGTALLFMLGSSGNFYRKTVGSGAPTNLRVGNLIASPANGMTVWGPAGGTTLLYYWMQTKIGTWDMSGSYPTGWSDTAYSISQGFNSTYNKPVHQFVGNVYYGNGDVIGALLDNGAGAATHSSNVLDFPTKSLVTALSDDGQYLVIATTENGAAGQALFAKNTFYFWDTFSVSWNRQYTVNDPFIYSVQKLGGAIYAFGQYGVYEITFAGGVKKILSRYIGTATATNLYQGYLNGRSIIYNNDALMFATDTTIDTLGKLQSDVPNAYFKHFKVPSGKPTFIDASLDVGRVYVATDTPKLYAYDFNGSTHDSGNTAQTVYIPLPSKASIKRVDVIFGEPLASGDAVSIGVYKDQDTAVTTFGSATFAADGAIRRKSLFKAIEVDSQLSLLITFTSGAVKIKAIEIYADPETP